MTPQQHPIINLISSESDYNIISHSLYWDILNNLNHGRTREINNLRREWPWRDTIHANTMWN